MTQREWQAFGIGMAAGLTIMWFIATIYLISTGYLPV